MVQQQYAPGKRIIKGALDRDIFEARMIDTKPLVSIIIPMYNAEKHIAATIQNALDQSWPNKEVIVIDDGSVDSSLTIAASFTSKGVTLLTQKQKGAGAARNYGLQIAKGKYIQFLDADDLLSDDKIAAQMQLLITHPEKVAICSTIHFNDGEDPYANKPSLYEDSFLMDSNSPADFLINLYGGNTDKGSMITIHSWLSPLSILRKAGPWSETYSLDDDGEYFCRVVLASSGIVYAREGYNYYRKYSANKNLSATTSRDAYYGQYQLFLSKKKHLLAATSSPLAKKALARQAMELAVNSYLTDKNISTKLLTTIEELGSTTYVPVLGGKVVEYIKNVLGWRSALRIREIYNTVFSK